MLKMAKTLRLSYVVTRQYLEGIFKQSALLQSKQIDPSKYGCISVSARKYCSSQDEWKQISDEITRKKAIPIDATPENEDPLSELRPHRPSVPKGGSFLSGRNRMTKVKLRDFSVEKVEEVLQTMVKKKKVDLDDDSPIKMPDPYKPPARKCILCKYDVPLDYKNVQLLSQFISPQTGRIRGRHVTGLCIPMQRHISKLIKRSRVFGFMPYLHKQPEYLDDPEITGNLKRRLPGGTTQPV